MTIHLVRCINCNNNRGTDCPRCDNSGFLLDPRPEPIVVELFDETGACRTFINPPEAWSAVKPTDPLDEEVEARIAAFETARNVA